MHIFIDESGTFSQPTDGRHTVSAVGALVIRDDALKGVEKLYQRMRRSLPKEKGEVKGRLLDETQVAAVASILRKTGCLFEAVAIDSALNTAAEIDSHKMVQAKMLTKNLTDEHHPNLVEKVWELRKALEAMPRQLYLQNIALSELLYTTIEHANIYHSFRWPNELSKYHWIIDAKAKDGITDWESWWLDTVLPTLESKIIRAPFTAVEGGNYSAQERFRTTMSDYKIEKYGLRPDEDFFDLNLMLKEDLRFSSSAESGLELVDILVNGIRRAMNGNLGNQGWESIRGLMIHRKGQYISLLAFAPERVPVSSLPYYQTLRSFTRGGKSMLPPSAYDTSDS